MKRCVPPTIIGLLACVTSLVGLGGCPVDLASIDTQNVQLPPEAAGTYWVEHIDGDLEIYRMPEDNEDPGTWYTIEMDPPDWYTVPALYSLDEGGVWQQESEGDGQTLDDWLQLWDAAPAVP